MEVAGMGLSNMIIPVQLNSKDGNTIKVLPGFNQLLAAAMGGKGLMGNMAASFPNTPPMTDPSKLLSFLKLEDPQQLNGGKQLLQGLLENPGANVLKTVLDFLGISDQKWSEIVTEFGGHPKDQVGDEQDMLEAILSGLAGLSGNQLLQGLNGNTQLVLKAAKLFDLLSAAKDPGSQQHLASLLETISGNLQGVSQTDQKEARQQYLDQTFSKVANELNKASTEPVKASSTDRASALKLAEWNGSHQAGQVWTKPEQIAMMADSSKKPVTASDLQQQFQAILAKSQFSKSGGLQKLFIKLNPEHLGSLRIELVQKDQTIVAKIITSTNMAKEALESHLNGLKHAFAAQNIQVDRIEIGQQASLPERFLKDNQQNGQNQPQQGKQEQQQTENEDEAAEGFTLSFEDVLLNTEV